MLINWFFKKKLKDKFDSVAFSANIISVSTDIRMLYIQIVNHKYFYEFCDKLISLTHVFVWIIILW